MRFLQSSQRLPGVLHSERRFQISSAGLARLVASLSGALAAGVLIELVLFRMFARTGIYLLHDGTPRWVYQAYRTVVWVGNTALNFTSILAIILFVAIAGYLWVRRDAGGRMLPMMAAAMVPWNLALFFFSSGSAFALVYLALSVGIVIASVAVVWRTASKPTRAAFALLAASFLCVYYFEAIAPLRILGWVFNDHGIGVFQIGEGLAGAGILAAFVAWGRTRKVRLIAPGIAVGILLAIGYASGSERFPLISTWALGVTMSLPVLVYAVGIPLLVVTVLKLVTSGRSLLGFGLAFLFLSHRMLPLTYFNLLVLGGFLLIAIGLLADRSLDSGAGEGNDGPILEH